MAKQTASNNKFLAAIKAQGYSKETYRRILNMINDGDDTEKVLDWLVMNFIPSYREERKAELRIELGLITSDSAGKGVAASSGNRIIGKAIQAGVSGDVVAFIRAAPNQVMA